MRGHEQIIAARLDGLPVRRVDIDVLQASEKRIHAGIESDGGWLLGRIEVGPRDNVAALDLRCCYGLAVAVFADDYAHGWPVVARVMESEPFRVSLVTGDVAVRVDPEGKVSAWDL